MLETSARLLRLLTMLQSRPQWTGAELADRLGVTTRTIRKDVERIRSLGYVVDAMPGVSGGYRLGAGPALPPLLLDDDEAVAVAIALTTAAAGGVSGIEEASARVRAKLDQVLPARLRHRTWTLGASLLPVASTGPQADAAVLYAIAAACRDHERLRFDYRDHEGASSVRAVEPHSLVYARGRWYLVAWDLNRDDWRTFRVDRVDPRPNTGPRFAPRPPPGGDAAAYVSEGLVAAVWRFRARVTVHESAEKLAGRLPPTAGVLEAIDEHRCSYTAGADSPQVLALWLGMLDADFEVHEPPELVESLRRLGDRFHASVKRDAPTSHA